jgi:hypothetical protein
MVVSFSPEFRLAAACSIWPTSDRRIEAIHDAARERLDWPRFLRVARRHGVISLVHDGLTRARLKIPPQVAEQISDQAACILYENLAMATEALRLQRLFDDANLSVLFVKGASLAVLAFGNLGLRGGIDIDLLVAPETLLAATALLTDAGYRRFDPPPDITDAQLRLLMPLRKDLGFVHDATGLRVELHWRLFLNPFAMAKASLMAQSRVVPLTADTGLRTLGEEDLFAYLCMHGALHWWNQLKWLADINALLPIAPEAVERLFGAAEARGAGRAAAQALRLCNRLLGTPLPGPCRDLLAKSATVRWLETTALNVMTTGQGEGDPHQARFGTTRGSLSTFLLNPSWQYWRAELTYHLTNQTDVLAIPLPGRLQFLYPVLRFPLWTWRHLRRGTGRQNETAVKGA